jgi:penicillin-binding protein 2
LTRSAGSTGNRCIQDQYPLGSAFKAVVALAALNLPDEARRITAQTTFYCSGTFRLTRGSRWSWDCYHQHAHGEMNVVQAIKKSCNVFFYNVGQRIGPDAIVELADRFGLGHLTGVALPDEHAGVNPTREWQASGDWRAEPYRHWYPGHTVNLSIGQSPLEVTPLQVAQLYSAVAMDGVEFKPRLVTKIVGPDGAEESFAPQSRRIELSAESLALVKEGLREVTREGGTAAEAFKDLQELNVAGKTSTAEVGEGDNKKNHAWFIAFAPADAPQIVVVVLVEEGETGGHTAAPLAAEFLKAYFAGKE